MKRLTSTLFALGLVCLAGPVYAQASFQFAAPDLNLPDRSDVSGIRISLLHGKNRSQRGLDLGLLSMSETSTFSGLGLIGGISRVTGNMEGGAALSFVNWHDGHDSGMNGAFINIVNDTRDAFNLGFVNVADNATSFDLGGFNMSRSSTAQVGFLNVTDRIESFQIGFLNMAKNGFLPVFPFVNFPAK